MATNKINKNAKRLFAVNVNKWTIAAVLSSTLCAQVALASENLYRYRNVQGVIVIEDRIPPEFVAQGYEVLTRQGQLVMAVPPKTQQEQSLDLAEEALQQSEDRFLLSSFSKVKDIESSRDRKLAQLHREVEIIAKNLEDIKNQRIETEQQAANIQRGGRDVPTSVLTGLANLKDKETEAYRMKTLREQEVNNMVVRYSGYVARFKILRPTEDDGGN